jgi:hypothetical protein
VSTRANSSGCNHSGCSASPLASFSRTPACRGQSPPPALPGLPSRQQRMQATMQHHAVIVCALRDAQSCPYPTHPPLPSARTIAGHQACSQQVCSQQACTPGPAQWTAHRSHKQQYDIVHKRRMGCVQGRSSGLDNVPACEGGTQGSSAPAMGAFTGPSGLGATQGLSFPLPTPLPRTHLHGQHLQADAGGIPNIRSV